MFLKPKSNALEINVPPLTTLWNSSFPFLSPTHHGMVLSLNIFRGDRLVCPAVLMHSPLSSPPKKAQAGSSDRKQMLLALHREELTCNFQRSVVLGENN